MLSRCWLRESGVMRMLIGGGWCYVDVDWWGVMSCGEWYYVRLVMWLLISRLVSVEWCQLDADWWKLISGKLCYVDVYWRTVMLCGCWLPGWCDDLIGWCYVVESDWWIVLQSDWWLVIGSGMWLVGGNARWDVDGMSVLAIKIVFANGVLIQKYIKNF